MARALLLAFLCVFCFSGPAFAPNAGAAEEEVLIVASDCTWPPMEILDNNKQPDGYSVDYIKEVAKAAGLKVQPQNVAWDGILGGVMTGKYDIVASSVTITPERKAQIDFTDPYLNVDQVVIMPAGKKIDKLEDLAGKKVGGQIATTGIFEMRKANVPAELKEYDDVGLAIQDLVGGRIDAVICDDPVAMYYVNKKPDTAGKLNTTFKVPSAESYGFAIAKNRPELLKKLNEGIKKVKESGMEAQLRQKWMGD